MMFKDLDIEELVQLRDETGEKIEELEIRLQDQLRTWHKIDEEIERRIL